MNEVLLARTSTFLRVAKSSTFDNTELHFRQIQETNNQQRQQHTGNVRLVKLFATVCQATALLPMGQNTAAF